MNITTMKRKLQGQEILGQEICEQDLRAMDVRQGVIRDARFRNCNLKLSNFYGTFMTNVGFYDCDLSGSSISCAQIRDVKFFACDLTGTNFVSSIATDVIFTDCDLSYSSFREATSRGVTFEHSNLRGANLDFLENTGAIFIGSNLHGVVSAFNCQFWNSQFDARSCEQFAAMLARVWPSDEGKKALVELSGELTFRAVDRLMKEGSTIQNTSLPTTESGVERPPSFDVPVRQFQTP